MTKNGTKSATGGLGRITRLVPQVKVRVLGFCIAMVFGSVFLILITRSLSSQLDQLQKDHAAVKTESFYLGVHLRGTLRGLNENLLQFGISRDPTFRETFLNDSKDLRAWIDTNKVVLADAANLQLLNTAAFSQQHNLLSQISTNYDAYLVSASTLLAQTNLPPSEGSFENTYKAVRAISSSLFPLCNDLVQAERQAFTQFLGTTQETLAKHQRLLTVSWFVGIALAIVLAVLVYRGMIAPLRMGLRESSTIIERQEKLAALGVLASGVAHEIRNPLTAIKFRLFSLKKATPHLADNEDISVISNEINRVEHIVRHFFQFARPPEPRLAKVNLAHLLTDVQKLFQLELESSGIRIEADSGNEPPVYADYEQIKQILINLVKNAAESIGRNGQISLRARTRDAELGGRNRRAAVLSVTDTGKGIPEEVELRIFDPFFTTKDQGAGLGLAISARIAEKHGGLLTFHTELNKGTTFELVLPATE